MKSLAIVLLIFCSHGRRSAANKFLRIPVHKPAPVQQKITYLRVDAAVNSISLHDGTQDEGWEEEGREEITMELDQLGQFFEETEETVMDLFELEQIEDFNDPIEQKKNELLQIE